MASVFPLEKLCGFTHLSSKVPNIIKLIHIHFTLINTITVIFVNAVFNVMASAAASSTFGGKEPMAQRPDALQSLRNEIHEVIRPYTTADEESPFSGGELVVMALVDTDEESLPKDRILRWIINTFKYYHDVFIDKAFQTLEPDPNFGSGSDEAVFENITEAFTEYEVPIRESRRVIKRRDTSFWSVTTQAARVYLRDWLEPERGGVFPFLNLPPEIRNNIYEHLLAFPSSGIHVQESEDDDKEGFDVFFLQRIDEPRPCGRKWSDSLCKGSQFIIKKSMDDILALSYVNRQVYEEAMPLFYMLNMFHFDPYSFELIRFVDSMPRSRFEHLRKLHLDLEEDVDEWLIESWPDITEVLSAKAVGFAELRISMTDDAWLGRGWKARQLKKSGHRTSRYSCIEDIDGFTDLAVVVARATVVHWEGECPLIRMFIEKEIARIKS
ncbi:hypothetical protein KC318_g9500 [Hortaea werneckii]|nr:hypothetical protein KC334_g9231 [Hortaea werneckii]KAI7003773.1 hypothetical protein KC355_g9049 [Hortaea werneckii]KAI7661387.1 hypothetical protein KC318_g9500 [Hortaea werneckii]